MAERKYSDIKHPKYMEYLQHIAHKKKVEFYNMYDDRVINKWWELNKQYISMVSSQFPKKYIIIPPFEKVPSFNIRRINCIKLMDGTKIFETDVCDNTNIPKSVEHVIVHHTINTRVPDSVKKLTATYIDYISDCKFPSIETLHIINCNECNYDMLRQLFPNMKTLILNKKPIIKNLPKDMTITFDYE